MGELFLKVEFNRERILPTGLRRIVNRPGGAGTVLQTHLSFIKSVRNHPLGKYLQNTLTPKLYELGS